MASTIVLWVYIALLVAGGLVGFLKAGSKISLITSLIFGGLLALCALGILPSYIADVLLALLLVVFGVRFAKGKKFMPAGLLVVLSLLALISRRLF